MIDSHSAPEDAQLAYFNMLINATNFDKPWILSQSTDLNEQV
jgi:hypothetical protein